MHLSKYLQFTFCLLLGFSFENLFSQGSTTLTINTPQPTGDYIARDKIIALPGSKFIATTIAKSHLFLDESLIVPATYQNSNNFNSGPNIISRNLDLGKEVGTTLGHILIQPDGSANYNIPIKIPSGTNQLVPNLSVNYNSLSDDNTLGMGWALGGLSSVSRSNGGLYNGSVKGIELTNDDWFSLEGSKLIALSGNNGVDGSSYGTELESFSQIISHGATGNGPEWFEVNMKDGRKVEYGKNTDSRLIPDGQNTALTWLINKISDNYGNYIEYKYHNSNGEIWIDAINFTGNQNAGISAYNSIKFYYEERTDKKLYYFNGGKVKCNVLLNKIKIFSENELVSEYDFNYKININSYLSEIIEKGSDNKEYNSTLIDYGDENPTATIQQPSIPTSANGGWTTRKYQLIDYNFDGLEDLISWNGDLNTGTDASEFLWFNWCLSKNNNSGSFQNVTTTPIPVPSAPQIDADFSAINSRSLGDLLYEYVDVNGDGYEDLVFNKIQPLGGTVSTPPTGAEIQNIIYLSNGTGLSYNSTITIPLNSFTSISSMCLRYADFNGDQKLDFVLAADNKIKIWTDMTSTSPNFDISLDQFGLGTSFNLKNILPLDINGDGKTEIVNIKTPSGQSCTLKNTGLNPQLYTSSTNAVYAISDIFTCSNGVTCQGPGGQQINLYGDFNGDNKPDYLKCNYIAVAPSGSFSWKMNFGKGNEMFEEVAINTTFNSPYTSPGACNCSKYYFANDMNSDGRTDVLEFSKGTSLSLTVYYSTGVDFVQETYPITNITDFNLNSYQIDFSDFNGDGIQDVFLFNRQGFLASPYIIYLNRGGKSRFINEIVNGLNFKIEVEFETLTNGSNLYQRTSSETYPLNTINGAYYVVSSLTTPDGIGGQNITNYNYFDCLFHKQGKGLLGFKKVINTNNVSGYTTTKEYEFNSTYFFTQPKKTILSLTSTSAPISTEIYTNNTIGLGSQRYYNGVSSIELTNNISGGYKKSDFTYDNYGNLLYKKIDTQYGLDVEEETYQYTNAGSWIPSKPSQLIRKITRATGGYPYTRQTNFNYNTQGQLEQVIYDIGDLKSSEIYYTFDNNTGVVLNQTISAPAEALPLNTTNYVYDLNYRHTVKTINALGHITESVYNKKWENPVKIIQVDGLTTNSFYDGFGRIIKKNTPEGLTPTISYEWVQPGSVGSNDPLNVSDVIYKIQTNMPGKPTDIVYYDFLGRDKRIESDGFTNKLYKCKIYDNRGNLFKETSTFEIGTPTTYVPTITEYYYDFLNRLWKTQVTDGGPPITTSMVFSFSGGNATTTTTFPDLKTKKVVTDGSGLMTESTDNGGILTFDYYSNRKIYSTKLNGLAIATYDYDKYGNQILLDEKNSGLNHYIYNSYGQIISQTDANSKTYNYQYNELGAIVQKTGPGELYSYQYIASGNGLGQLEKITSSNNIFYQYAYDNLSRPIQYTENIQGQTFQTLFEYDSYNKIFKKTYPSGFSIVRDYTPQGYLSKIKRGDNGLMIWEAQEFNPLGKITKYKYGNNLISDKAYNNYGVIQNINVNGIMNMSYNFNLANGNLNNRQDVVNNLTETFSYDNLNRLQQWQVNGAAPYAMTYDNNGNILSKTDIGSYTYLNNKVNAVELISNPNGIISSIQQDVQYTPFNKTQSIIEGDYELQLTYGPDQERKKSELYYQGNSISTKYYLPEYEKEIASSLTRQIHYIYSTDGLVAMYVIENTNANMFYTHTDFLGSIINVTDQSGNNIASQNFDPWGRKRDPSTWTYSTLPSIPAWLYRGYTGHEDLPIFDLINMNGRMYDPIVGLFLSPDPMVADATSTADYNRYNYARNNPFKYIDPSGNTIIEAVIIGAMIGAFISMFAATLQGNDAGGIIGAGIIGAAVGALGGYVGGLTSAAIPIGGFIGGAASGAAAGFAGSAANSLIYGAIAGDPLNVVLSNSLKDGLKGAAIGGVIGGASNALLDGFSGRDPFTGYSNTTSLNSSAPSNLSTSPVQEKDLNTFVNTNFESRMSKFTNKPKISVNDQMVIENRSGPETRAVTIPDSYDKASPTNIYLKSDALNTERFLYLTIDHELQHAYHYDQGYFAIWKSLFGHNNAVAISEKFAYTSTLSVASRLFPKDASYYNKTLNKAVLDQYNEANSTYNGLINR
jgi:RHS repeat-associated protein